MGNYLHFKLVLLCLCDNNIFSLIDDTIFYKNSFQKDCWRKHVLHKQQPYFVITEIIHIQLKSLGLGEVQLH